MFVNLHLHTEYSLLDGKCTIPGVVQKAKKYNQPAVAITDHGNLHAFVEFYKTAKKENVKPIIGIEFYIVDNMHIKKSRDMYHLIVLAKNEKGLKNINKLSTLAYLQGFYYKPRIDFNTLKEYSEGLIVLSACIAGQIPKALEQNNIKEAERITKEYQDVFGEDFYIEIQANKMPEQIAMNQKLAALARRLQIPIVATSDIHYLNKEEYAVHDAILALQTGKKIKDKDRFKFPNNQFYFKSEEEVRRDLFDTSGYEDIIDEAIKNTVEIANKCNLELKLNELKLPIFEVPEGETLDSYLQKLAFSKLFSLYLEKDIDYKKYAKRLRDELEVIINKGYSGYFLIVQDFVQYAKENNILVGPGRGSAAGSLLSYVLGITALDPIKYGLLFERFLNPERTAMPDIDIDFDEGRELVIKYVTEKYGKDKVAHIGSFGTMAGKQAIKDAGRVLDYDFHWINNNITKIMPEKTIKKSLEVSEDLLFYKNKYRDLFELAEEIENKPKSFGPHPCAMLITPESVTEYVPLLERDGNITTQTEMYSCEDLGLLKMDFLGLATLDIIKNTIKFIHQRDNLNKFDFVPTIENIYDIPLDDKNVYKKIYSNADTNGVFQCESQLFKGILKKMKPTKFEHIIALLSIGRPGPLEAGIVDDYIACLHGEKEPEYPHEDLKEVLEETFGFMIYQEQIMFTAQIISGYSLGQADILRRGVGKKKPEVIAEEKPKFIQGAINNGYSHELAEHLFELIEYFAGYGFNKSHISSVA